VEDSFKLLEERVGKAAARLRELRSENETLRGELKAAATRAQKSEEAQRAAVARAEKAESERKAAAERAAAAERQATASATHGGDEVEELRRQSEQLRQRMLKLLQVLEKLD